MTASNGNGTWNHNWQHPLNDSGSDAAYGIYVGSSSYHGQYQPGYDETLRFIREQLARAMDAEFDDNLFYGPKTEPPRDESRDVTGPPQVFKFMPDPDYPDDAGFMDFRDVDTGNRQPVNSINPILLDLCDDGVYRA